ncbi:energy transducer TonB [Spirosoma sp.]|uniref:energy transducer TonB n=1 Tax=Spirosoma sp. TaxID=1899569 RepID=UPI003B3B39FC
MKTLSLIAIYWLITSTVSIAQVSDENSTTTLVARNTPDPGRSAVPSADFTPLTNKPFFPGGKQALEKHLETIDLYSNSALKAYSEGTVQVRFRVQPNGSLTDIQIVKSCGPLLDAAAVKAIVTMPHWYPAHRAGVAVSSLVELPITFRND